MKYLIIISALFLQACAVAIPTHQINSPQSLGNNVLEATAMYGTGAAVGPDFEDGTPPDTTIRADVTDEAFIFGGKIAYGLNDRTDIEIEALASFFAGSTSIVGLKYQWLGEPVYKAKAGDSNSAIRLRYISSSGWSDYPEDSAGSDTIFDDIFVEDMDASGYSAALSYGYLVTNWFGVYVGGQVIAMDLKFRYREDDANGTLYVGDRSIDGWGPFAGIHFNTTGQFFRFRFTGEYAYTNLPYTYESKTGWYDNLMLSANFLFNFDR